MPEKVALARAESYAQPELRAKIREILDASGINARPGLKILVKPNLLMAHDLACTTPDVVACACEWLLERGANVLVADSPAFGTAESVARAIGLDAALKPLGLAVKNFQKTRSLAISLANGEKRRVGAAAEALDADLILSIPRLKAHSQMRLTLAVKNCYGCIRGLRKAIYHARFGASLEYFSDCVVAFWAKLPPVAALCDGVVAMSGTGPRNGQPLRFGLLGASAFAVALDWAILSIPGFKGAEIPLADALARRGVYPQAVDYPLARPDDFSARDFRLPQKLKEISFNPLQMGTSLLRRIWHNLRH